MRRPAVVLALAAWLLIAGGADQAGAADNLSGLAFRPHPGAALPLAVALRGSGGEPVTLGTYFTGSPVVLVLDYLRCKTLCGLTLTKVIEGLRALPLAVGRDYQLVTVSIDPRDQPADAAAAKAKYLAGYDRPSGVAGIHFLTGSAPAVSAVAEAVGFPYRYDAELDQYIHPAGFVIAAADGRISRYIFGVDPSPIELQSALANAARGETPSVLTRLLLLCHIEGRPLGRYTLPVEAAFALANLAGLAALIAIFATIWRRRRG